MINLKLVIALLFGISVLIKYVGKHLNYFKIIYPWNVTENIVEPDTVGDHTNDSSRANSTLYRVAVKALFTASKGANQTTPHMLFQHSAWNERQNKCVIYLYQSILCNRVLFRNLFKHILYILSVYEVNKNEPGHEKTCLMSYANNKGADQPAHARSLISAFVVRCLDRKISIDSTAEISRL